MCDSLSNFNIERKKDRVSLTHCNIIYCQAIFEGLDFPNSRTATREYCGNRERHFVHLFLQSYSSCVNLVVILGNLANWSAFPETCPCDLARPRLRRRTIGPNNRKLEVVFLHVAFVHGACPVHGRVDCWQEKTRPRS